MFYAFPFWERCGSCAACAYLCCCCLCPCPLLLPLSPAREVSPDISGRWGSRRSTLSIMRELQSVWYATPQCLTPSILAHTLVHISSLIHIFIPHKFIPQFIIDTVLTSTIHDTCTHLHTSYNLFMQYIHRCGLVMLFDHYYGASSESYLIQGIGIGEREE